MDMNMNKRDLKKLSKSELIKMLLKQKESKKVHNHVDLLDNDPFKDEVSQPVLQPITLLQKPTRRIPKPTRKPPPPPIKEHTTNVPSSNIKELNRALKGHAKSYRIKLQDNLNPLNHFTKARSFIKSHLEDLLKTMKGFKFVETLEIRFMKQEVEKLDSINKYNITIYKTAFFNGKAKTITKCNDIEHELNTSRQEILDVIEKWVSEGSGWTIDTIDNHYLNITTYKPLNGSSYIELPMKLKKPKNGLINLQNKGDKCFR